MRDGDRQFDCNFSYICVPRTVNVETHCENVVSIMHYRYHVLRSIVTLLSERGQVPLNIDNGPP